VKRKDKLQRNDVLSSFRLLRRRREMLIVKSRSLKGIQLYKTLPFNLFGGHDKETPPIVLAMVGQEPSRMLPAMD
jgi:hypothetical protein